MCCVRFECLTVVSLKTRVFWDVRLCRMSGAFVCGGQPVQEADGYTLILWKVANYLRSNTVLHPRRLECSSSWNFGQYIPSDKYRNYIYMYIYFFKYNQWDATLYNILYYVSMLYMFQAVSPPIIRSSKTVHTACGICQACWLLLLAVAANKLDIYQMLCTVFELLMMGGETAWNM